MSKLKASTFKVRASFNGYSTLSFSGGTGRVVDIEFPSADLPTLIKAMQAAVKDAPAYMRGSQLSQSSLNNVQHRLQLTAEQPKPFVPGPHGAFEFGVTSDLTSVIMTIHVPSVGQIDHVMPPEDASAVLSNLARVVTLVKSQKR